MIKTPKSLRLQIGIFGRMNTGKSSFLNMAAGQDIAVTSPQPGTTTDAVEKNLELLPIGPVTFLDTAGLDDVSELGAKRIEKAVKILNRADVVFLITEAGIWGEYEEKIAKESASRGLPVITIINKTDLSAPDEDFIGKARQKTNAVLSCSSVNNDFGQRAKYLEELKSILAGLLPESYLKSPRLMEGLISEGGFAILITPIDKEAPKGRMILPQAQVLRAVLDSAAAALVVKETEYAGFLKLLNRKPDIVICDSQAVDIMVAETPEDIKQTTFSILFSRFKGDLIEEVKGAAAIGKLEAGDRILIAEACSHHAIEDDIGRVKIPKWLKSYTGKDIKIDHASGRDYPDDLSAYKCIIHCGACMFTRREKINRIEEAKKACTPITNYGIAISLAQGVLQRALSPFPEALEAFKNLSKNG